MTLVNGEGERKKPQPPPPVSFFSRVLAPLPRLRLATSQPKHNTVRQNICNMHSPLKQRSSSLGNTENLSNAFNSTQYVVVARALHEIEI